MRLTDDTNPSQPCQAASLEMDDARALLDEAIAAHYHEIRTAIRRHGAGRGQATEIVHDLYVQLSRRPERILGKASLRAFLIRAAINLGIDRARRSAFEARLFQSLDMDVHPVPAVVPQAEARIDMPRRLRALRAAILALPPQRRDVFIASRLAGMDKDEIAERLGITRGMVNRHLRKAMVHCMDKMDEFEAG
ncbi:RNA polymerase sigma factor [Amorphus coralli]|uniref:RNA polymerase sigma factor n=1 Tax=Amorphus coralli TaxID=340680 RepID=UPI000362232C|nr:RNA polymerase sigma factor [Amorphus coralli]